MLLAPFGGLIAAAILIPTAITCLTGLDLSPIYPIFFTPKLIGLILLAVAF
jgi:hypothetical protein